MSKSKETNKTDETVTFLIAREVELNCPHCNATQDGFIGDPRGFTFECEHCNNSYTIHREADIEMY